jgi:alkylated DNA repair dioxygenase AlkB
MNAPLTKEIEVARPGIVVLRKVLSNEEQERIVDLVKRHGGLRNKETDEWNFFGRRGRSFDSLSNYESQDEAFLRECFQKMSDQAQQANAEIPKTGVSHVLTWWYPDEKGMGWHTDGYGGNDGDRNVPIFSLTVGNSCLFEWRPVHPNEYEKDNDIHFLAKESTVIESGDVIVFGGPQRMMLHRVAKVFPGDFRINITFRYLADFTDDAKFETDAYVSNLRAK